MSNQSGTKSFWTTLPGILTAVAGLITAITGLITVLGNLGFLGFQSSPTETHPAIVSTIPPTAIVSKAPTETPPPSGTTECVLTIKNPLAWLRSTPSTWGITVNFYTKPGDYLVLDYQEGWFQIKSGRNTGWIQDNTWAIADKSNSCP